MQEEIFMKMAVDIALENVLTNKGGPFGAVIVKDGRVISVGRNQVVASTDPTAHAEIQAIRSACQHLKTINLKDCEIYTSAEPCPMCLSAIYWSRMKTIYYANTAMDAAKIGFDDQYIYDQFTLSAQHRSIPMRQILTDNYNLPFKQWENEPGKTMY